MKPLNSIVITGLGIEIPGIESVETLLNSLDAPLPPATFDPVARLGRKGLRYKDTATKLALCAGKAALTDAGLPTSPDEQLAPVQTSVITSSNLGNVDTVCRVVEAIRAGGVDETSPMELPNASSNIIASSLAIWFGLRGPNLMLCNGATSGADALFVAANLIRAGRAERVLVVGVEVANSMAIQLMRDSLANQQQSAADLRLCEGAGAVVLESADAAARREARVYAHIDGYGTAPLTDGQVSLGTTQGIEASAPDLWLLPSGADGATRQVIDATRARWKGSAMEELDLGIALGETYGAQGVLQCIAACLWLKKHSGRSAVMTSGAGWGDGLTSLWVKALGSNGRGKAESHKRRQQRHQGQLFELALPEIMLRTYEIQPASATGPAIAFVHGMEGRWDSWTSVWEYLHPQFRSYSLELPWAGQQDYRWSLVRQPHDYIKSGLELIPADITMLVAHSFGANAVLEYITNHPIPSLKALVLIAPFFKPSYELFDWDVLNYYIERFQALLEDGVRVRQPPERPPHPPEVRAALGEKIRDRIGPYGWMQFFLLFSRTPALHLQAVQVPCLVLGGSNDFASLPEDCAALADALPHARVEILSQCGHFCMLEQPQLVARAINQFLGTASGLSD